MRGNEKTLQAVYGGCKHPLKSEVNLSYKIIVITITALLLIVCVVLNNAFDYISDYNQSSDIIKDYKKTKNKHILYSLKSISHTILLTQYHQMTKIFQISSPNITLYGFSSSYSNYKRCTSFKFT